MAVPLELPILEVERLVAVAGGLPGEHRGGEPSRLVRFPFEPAFARIVVARPSAHTDVEVDHGDPVAPDLGELLGAVASLLGTGPLGLAVGFGLGGAGDAGGLFVQRPTGRDDDRLPLRQRQGLGGRADELLPATGEAGRRQQQPEGERDGCPPGAAVTPRRVPRSSWALRA